MIKNIARGIEKLIREESKKADKARVIALNRAARSAVAQTVKFIRETYNIKASDLKDEIKVNRANISNQRIQLRVSHKAIALVKYGARQTAKGISFKEKKGERKFVKSAFIATVGKGRHLGVFKRKTSKRFPIKELYGPSAMQLISSEVAQQFIEKIFYERFKIELERAIQHGKF